MKNLFKGNLLLIFCSILFIVACSDSDASNVDGTTGEVATNDITIGVTNMTMKESVYEYMKQAAEARADELGVELIWQSSENDPTKQLDQVQNFISQGVDVIAIEPARSDAASQHVQLARDADIPVINLEALILDAEMELRMVADNYKIGEMQVEDFAEVWGDEPANVVVLSGTDGDESAGSITQGVLDTLENNSHFELIVQQGHANWDRQLAMNTMENALVKHNNDIQVVFANNDQMALGAMGAAKNAGALDDILFYGSDADKESIELLIDGTENFKVVDRGSMLQGERIVDAAIELSQGKNVDYDETIQNGEFEIPIWWTPMELITKDNLEPMEEKYPELFK